MRSCASTTSAARRIETFPTATLMAAVGFASVNDIACSKLLTLPEAVQERVRVGKTTIEDAYRIGRPADRGFEDTDLRKYAKQPQRTTENALVAAKSAEEERAALGPGERGAGGRAAVVRYWWADNDHSSRSHVM